jgi:hypothetical protein
MSGEDESGEWTRSSILLIISLGLTLGFETTVVVEIGPED